ncbi:MAG: septum site-determining protein MinC [Lachnospiraceae bacterium]|nr:septum site-determining protein MinC [Lachnospiraceae bacterium]
MNEVVIKKYTDGLTVILNPDIPFESLYTALGRKFRESASFFGEAKLVISFEGRELYPEEERLLVDAISDNTDLTVIHIMGDDDERSSQYFKAANRFITNGGNMLTSYYNGTVRAGEILEADTDIVVLGDVNPGGEVISAGNIIIFGTLYGTAKAGSKGDKGNFVIADELKPVRVCIGEKVLTQFVRRSLFRAKTAPKILFVKDDAIVIEEIIPENTEKLAIGGLSDLKVRRRADDKEET